MNEIIKVIDDTVMKLISLRDSILKTKNELGVVIITPKDIKDIRPDLTDEQISKAIYTISQKYCVDWEFVEYILNEL